MAKDIEPKLKLISEYLKINSNEKFVIPEYQRGYSWDNVVQCDKLWQDIQNFIDSGVEDPYFFGTIIIDVAEDKKEFNLIDGQQRTTTFLLLLKALQLKLNNILETAKKDEDSERVIKVLGAYRDKILGILFKADEDLVYSISKDWKNTKKISILENRAINEMYPDELQKIISAPTYEKAEASVYKIPRKQKDNKYTNHFRNFKWFYTELNKCSDLQVKNFAKIFLEKCQVIEIRSWQVEQAITMFNSLNSTGMPLSDADILSAQLYSNSGKNKKAFTDNWKELCNLSAELNSRKIISIDSVLQEYMYIARSKSKEYMKNGYPDVTTPGLRNYYTLINKSILKKPMELCNEFLKIAEIWEKVSDYPVVKLLLRFNENIKLYLISYMYRFEVSEITEAKVRDVCECLIRLFAILELDNAVYSSKQFKTFLFGENIKLVDDKISVSSIKKDFDNHIRNSWNEVSILESIQSYEKNVLVYLNEYLFAKENKLKFNFNDSVNIEHIMPASGHNIATIRNDANFNSEEEFDLAVNSLGNKILLEEDINKSIGNEWFKTKKQTSITKKSGYKDSKYNIANALTSYKSNKWTKKDIASATERASVRILSFIFNNSKMI